MHNLYQRLANCISFIRSKDDFPSGENLNTSIGLIGGPELDSTLSQVNRVLTINFTDLPDFPISANLPVTGSLSLYQRADKTLLTHQRSFRYFEGYSMLDLSLPIRMMTMLGVEKVILSETIGSLESNIAVDDLVVLRDHINLLSDNPLIGKNIEQFGPRFPDMGGCYAESLISLAIEAAQNTDNKMKPGTYISANGPHNTTIAQLSLYQIIGADFFGYSLIPEVITASQCSLGMLATGIINYCIGESSFNYNKLIQLDQTAGENYSRYLLSLIDNIF